MMSTRNLAFAVALFSMTAGAQAQSWKIDKNHSSVGFTVKHLMVSKVNGNFDDFDGTINNFDGKNLSAASVEFTIQAASVDTRNQKRDDHLRSADFFAADSFPVWSFKSTQIIPGEGAKFQILGDLTIRGVTKPITFDAEFHDVCKTPNGQHAGFSATTTINRQDFNVSWSKQLDSGGLVAGNDVNITIEVEALETTPKS